MINPSEITNFNRTDEELEEFALFCPSVAGKRASVQAEKLDELLYNLQFVSFVDEKQSPFEVVQQAASKNRLEEEMRNVKLGKYSTLVPCFTALSLNDANVLREVSVETLKRYPGIGDKTARFFIMHSRRDVEVATLDTHILSWMDENLDVNVHPNAPRSTREYKRLEHRFLEEAERRGRHPAHLDLEIWNRRSNS
jgi:thermostable 8-oxoguanine DNA glycosylase